MRSLLLLQPKPPTIKAPSALNRIGDNMEGKVSSSSFSASSSSLQKRREKIRQAHGGRQCVIYGSSERSGNWK